MFLSFECLGTPIYTCQLQWVHQVHTSSEVQKISWEDGGWRVTWFDTEQRQQVFKFVIVASGPLATL